MNLEKLPKENGRDLLLNGIYETENVITRFIDCDLSHKMYNALTSDEWLKAFEEHYQNATHTKSRGAFESRMDQVRTMYVPFETKRLKINADSGHYALKFFIDTLDKEARDIVYSFLKRLKK